MEPILSAGDIVITRSIAKFGEASYQIANIGSVSLETKLGDTPMHSLLGFLCVISLLGCLFSVPLGIAGFGLAFGAMFFLENPKVMTVTLKTSSGDIQALTTPDSELAQRIKIALEEAFATRS
ncbi:DUF6232 family protein [Rhizobium leguminosarum]|uniref:DUF6232 family protein n=1 Tax=Rhizobium leguminosarum TaxID=384 RepID=UPI00103B7505|nr:DUF6232 family protein [Rhizobium leguminosarum]TBZ69033.1 hypothetical protein E0H61_32855 [Rhizobium leguminosarum bv. viciae]